MASRPPIMRWSSSFHLSGVAALDSAPCSPKLCTAHLDSVRSPLDAHVPGCRKASIFICHAQHRRHHASKSADCECRVSEDIQRGLCPNQSYIVTCYLSIENKANWIKIDANMLRTIQSGPSRRYCGFEAGSPCPVVEVERRLNSVADVAKDTMHSLVSRLFFKILPGVATRNAIQRSQQRGTE